MKTCFVESCSNPAVDSHHIFPLEYGGKDKGPKVKLCATCHDEIHRLSSRVLQNKVTINEIVDSTHSKLVQAIVNQWEVFQVTNNAPEARRRLVAHMSKQELMAAHFIKVRGGFSSLEKMVKMLIIQQAIKYGFPYEPE